jgi:hypothetical protein
MQLKKIIRYYILGESIKEIEMNRILDKISKKLKLTKKELNFLNLYNETSKSDDKDFMMISKNMVFKKVSELLSKNRKVICNLHDRDGKIGLQIISTENRFEDDECLLNLKGGETHKLHDKFLYNLIYTTKKDEYSLEEHDEYFEKLTISKDEN